MMFGENPGTDQTWYRMKPGSIGAELGVWKGDTTIKFEAEGDAYWDGDGDSGSVTVGQRCVATILFISASVCVITGGDVT